ncbi:MAG: hypothetical protein AAFW73_20880 [Bacteroidota bacterium]
MNIDIPACIAELLYEHDSVIIPDFGGIVGIYQAAQIDHVQGMMHPPSLALRFNENLVINDGVLISHLRNKFQLSLEDAQVLIREYVAQLQDKLQRKEIIVFPKVGRLYCDFDNNFRFLQDSTNYNTTAFGLPELQFFPILRNRETLHQEAPLPQDGSSQPVRQKRSWVRQLARQELVPMVAGGLVLVIALAILFGPSEAPAPAPFQAKPVADSYLNQKPVREARASIIDLPGTTETSERTPAPVAKAVPEAETEIGETPPMDTEESTLAPEQKVCVIITGAFGQKSSVKKRLRELIDLGFAPYQDKKGRLTRVGIQFAYEAESDIDYKLSILRDRVEDGSWVLSE